MPTWHRSSGKEAKNQGPAQLLLESVLSGWALCTRTGERKEGDALDLGSQNADLSASEFCRKELTHRNSKAVASPAMA